MSNTKSAFISFDYDNDKDIYGSRLAQSENPQLAFHVSEWSLKEPMDEKWKDEVRDRLSRVDLMIVICGEHTHDAVGVAAEVTIAREEGTPYFLLRRRRKKTCKKPRTARRRDEIHAWNQKNLKKLIAENAKS